MNMNDSNFFSILCASILAIASITVHAELIDRGDGLIYDVDQDITWLQDFNSLGYWPNWNAANAWADSLVFRGFDDWRLPHTPQMDSSCVPLYDWTDNLAYQDCTGGELGYLYYIELENIFSLSYFDNILNDYGPFINIQTGYWTSMRFDPTLEWPTDTGAMIPTSDNYHWIFYMNKGDKFVFGDGNSRAATAVRDGDVCGGYSLAVNTWTMFGLSCTPIAPATVDSVFGDDLESSQYGLSWVMYEWNTATDSYIRLLDTNSTLSQNKGYWILSLETANLDVEGSVTQAVVSTECPAPGCYEIPLVPPGDGETQQYNMVGHVFPGTVPIPWKDVRIKTNVDSIVSVYTPSEAALPNNNIMDKTIWIYNGNAYNEYDDITPGKEGQLAAFDGFWVRTLPGAPADTTCCCRKFRSPLTP